MFATIINNGCSFYYYLKVFEFEQYYSLSPGFWQSFISIEVCRDCIPALASSCKKRINGFLCLLIVFLKSKTYQLILKDVIKLNRNLQ